MARLVNPVGDKPDCFIKHDLILRHSGMIDQLPYQRKNGLFGSVDLVINISISFVCIVTIDFNSNQFTGLIASRSFVVGGIII